MAIPPNIALKNLSKPVISKKKLTFEQLKNRKVSNSKSLTLSAFFCWTYVDFSHRKVWWKTSESTRHVQYRELTVKLQLCENYELLQKRKKYGHQQSKFPITPKLLCWKTGSQTFQKKFNLPSVNLPKIIGTFCQRWLPTICWWFDFVIIFKIWFQISIARFHFQQKSREIDKPADMCLFHINHSCNHSQW